MADVTGSSLAFSGEGSIVVTLMELLLDMDAGKVADRDQGLFTGAATGRKPDPILSVPPVSTLGHVFNKGSALLDQLGGLRSESV